METVVFYLIMSIIVFSLIMWLVSIFKGNGRGPK